MTHPRYTGRAQRVRDFLAKLRPHGATLDLLLSAVDRNCRPLNMSATVGTLVNAGKVRKAKVRGVTRYYATDQIHVDGRIAANAVGKRRKKPARADSSDATTRRRQADRSPAAAAPRKAATAVRPMTRVAAVAPFKRPVVNALAGAETIDQFLARGGRIQRLRNGDVSQPLKHITA